MAKRPLTTCASTFRTPHAVAVDFMPPETIGAAMWRIAAMLAKGTISPLPPLTYSLGSAAGALRQLSAARHVGKIVVADSSSGSRPRGSSGLWVISGGLGALGALSARWLAGSGLRNLLLLGRSGLAESLTGAASGTAPSPVDTAGTLFDATAGGRWAAAVTLSKCDAASQTDVAAVVCGVAAARGMPMAGILHAGGLLRDATLQNQSLAGLRAVFAPKAAGSTNLSAHATLMPLAALNLFSSVAASLGSGGQANYAAANALLDASATGMQQQGVPGTAVGWGAWAGAGMAAHAGVLMVWGFALTCSTGADV